MTLVMETDIIRTPVQFREHRRMLARSLYNAPSFDRGEVHAQKVTTWEMQTMEVDYLRAQYAVSAELYTWQNVVKPNLPWAEEHFMERISGEPLNPPPSAKDWPFAQRGHEEHTDEWGNFSHTYPERFWPKLANVGGTMNDSHRVSMVPHVGIRFEYGDLDDLMTVIKKNPRTRQAYLPVWFPEDLNAASIGERVPCSMGYHFMMNLGSRIDCHYWLRSCDFMRFWQDDLYMAGRLLQYVGYSTEYPIGNLIVSIDNLHCFRGDMPMLNNIIGEDDDEEYGAYV